ncbi:glycosyltransferase family 2 protein [Segetibacter sp.]|jgi:biofilm PGA synthesis N-glycosyltransferase PgaC|uniref:glycosyltransferase family 2 protein n=1 Tax=Segetibacter sp. TaxID=2231182 RepID=UPI0026350C87|nr:glycosyltransferase family 2 protein [Segetibacter sp.]MCW3081248.1 glycosyltransferase family 2 protein [Segetibacter sp.]
MIAIFWICVFIIFYTYVGYGILLYLLVKIRQAIKGERPVNNNLKNLPSVTLIIAAYNEEHIIDKKIKNTLTLNYPADKIKYLFITDGSTDGTPNEVAKYDRIKLMHSPERSGKINAVHRAMKEVTTEVAIFTDANTFLNKEALINIARHYKDERVGAVSGEKRVEITDVSDATAGEGFYWKYESALKKLDSQLFSVVGAAGELFSIRTRLYEPVPADTILDDFMISLLIAAKGYRIVYEPDAFALESSSANTLEELKRKVRIAAGGIQSILRLRTLLNPFKFPVLSFQYISHRVLRWTITPLCMIIAFILNFVILFYSPAYVYKLMYLAQLLIYTAAFFGWLFERKEIKVKVLFIPFYFCMMNYAVLAGIVKFASNKQSAAWDKARRK